MIRPSPGRHPGPGTGREIIFGPIREAYSLRRPAFGSRLPGPDAVDPHTPVLISDVVEFAVEYRLYLLNGRVHSGSQYGQRPPPSSWMWEWRTGPGR